MIVDYPVRLSPAPESRGDEGCRLPAVVERGVSGKEAGPHVSGCVAVARARSVCGRFSAAPTFPLVVVLWTYFPSRVPSENFTAGGGAGRVDACGETYGILSQRPEQRSDTALRSLT